MGIIIVFIFIAILFYALAELFGRAKHIGRGWTFFLLMGGIIPGIIALILSPSAKKDHTSGSVYHIVAGWFSIVVLGVIGLIPSLVFLINGFTVKGTIGIPLSFIFLGFYLIELGNGRIVNRNPKFYFSKIFKSKISLNSNSGINIIKTQSISYEEQKKLILELKNNKVLDSSEYENKLKQIELEQEEELLQRTVNKRIKPDLKKLIDLKNANVLTDSEFNVKKDELISSFTEKIKNDSEFKDEITGTKQNAIYLNNEYWYRWDNVKKSNPLQILIFTIGLTVIVSLVILAVLNYNESERKSKIERQKNQATSDSLDIVHNKAIENTLKAYNLLSIGYYRDACDLLNDALNTDGDKFTWGVKGLFYLKTCSYRESIDNFDNALNGEYYGSYDSSNLFVFARGLAKLKLGMQKEGNKDIEEAKKQNYMPTDDELIELYIETTKDTVSYKTIRNIKTIKKEEYSYDYDFAKSQGEFKIYSQTIEFNKINTIVYFKCTMDLEFRDTTMGCFYLRDYNTNKRYKFIDIKINASTDEYKNYHLKKGSIFKVYFEPLPENIEIIDICNNYYLGFTLKNIGCSKPK